MDWKVIFPRVMSSNSRESSHSSALNNPIYIYIYIYIACTASYGVHVQGSSRSVNILHARLSRGVASKIFRTLLNKRKLGDVMSAARTYKPRRCFSSQTTRLITRPRRDKLLHSFSRVFFSHTFLSAGCPGREK